MNEGRTLFFADQAGFYLLPMAVRTWSPQGRTPILKETASRDRLSMMAALSPDGKLVTQTQEKPFDGKSVVSFLQRLLREIPGKITLAWDGAPIHRSKEVKAFLSEGGAKRLRLETFPAYSPELNPTERVWSHLKRAELGNVCCHDKAELRRELQKARERLRHKKAILQSFVQGLDYY